MHMDTFLQAFNRLGLTQWDGIEQDIAWDHVTSLEGLSRPSIEGSIFVHRAPCLIGRQSSHRVRLMATTNSGPEPLLVKIASHLELSIARRSPTPSWEGTLKGGLKGDLKVTSPPSQRRSEALSPPLR